MTLALDSEILDIDPKLAKRRAGSRAKEPLEAHQVLERMGVETVGDLLHHYPRRYIDRSRVQTIRDLRAGAYATVIATVQQGVQTADAARSADGHRDAVRRDRQARSDVLQPAVARLRLQGRAGSGRLRRRHALSRPYPDREPGGRAPPRRRVGPDPHGAHHAGAPGVGGHHDADDPRVGVRGPSSNCRRSPIRLPAELVQAESLSDYDQALRTIHFPEDRGSARPRAGAVEVRRAVHARARGRVPQASRGGRASRRRAHGVGLR